MGQGRTEDVISGKSPQRRAFFPISLGMLEQKPRPIAVLKTGLFLSSTSQSLTEVYSRET